jgi:hypothetical protein
MLKLISDIPIPHSLLFKSYAAAQADAVPPYWDTIVHAPSGMDTDAGMIVGDLPSGTILAFISNLFVSFFFQFIGFLLTYLLHTTHAAKFGSRAGLGLTLIQYGFYSRSATDTMLPTPDGNGAPDVLMLSAPPSSSAPMPQDNTAVLSISSREWLSFLLMTLGMRYLSSSSHLLTLSLRLVFTPFLFGRFLACKELGVYHPRFKCTRTSIT